MIRICPKCKQETEYMRKGICLRCWVVEKDDS